MGAPSGWSALVTALGLLLIIEGLALALLPDLLKRLVADILAQPAQRLRLGGVVSAAIGLAVVWFVRG